MLSPLSDAETLLNVAYHVFLPPKLPQQAPYDDHKRQVDHRLALLVLDAVERYQALVVNCSEQWARMSAMLSRLAQAVEPSFREVQLGQNMSQMQVGDVLALHIREQNAAVLIRQSSTATTFEIFEVQAPNVTIMSAPGKLVRHFPGPAIQVPSSTSQDPGFIEEVAIFLSRMSVDAPHSQVAALHEPANPHYISQLFAGILRGFGHEIEPHRVVKRIADEVLREGTRPPWRRSPIWLIIRVTLQTSLVSVDDYKNFMVYFHAHLLSLCCAETLFPDDLLSTMHVKMARRLLKVRSSAPAYVIEAAKVVSDQTEQVLQDRWSAIQANIPQFQPLDLDLDQAVVQSLPHSRTYLDDVLRGRPSSNKSSSFNPKHSPRFTGHPDFAVFANGALSTAFDNNKHVALFDFEYAVHNHLPTWVNSNLNEESSCTAIFSCFEQYISAALSYYTHDVADRSIMILTIMELWVALDRLATSQHSLLLDYSPEIPEDLIDVLLLRPSLHLERAIMIQTYLRHRHADSKSAARGSVFDAGATGDSLPVRFSKQSSNLQALKQAIEQDAELKRKQKMEELDKLNTEHAQLMESVSQSSCKYYEDQQGYQRHSESCGKCLMELKAMTMSIQVYEWPLPSKQLEVEAVVFELECPNALVLWRSATYRILCDLGGTVRKERASVHYTLAEYPGLSQWSGQLKSSEPRITLASLTPSFLQHHDSRIIIPAVESAVCVNNGLTFELFDSTRHTLVGGPLTRTSLFEYGTFTLHADSPYRYLQYSLAGTSHTSNQVIASQSDCPVELNLHEHYAFGTLRSGPRLQWMNMVRGLEENVFTYSREEISLLYAQAAWQIGPLSQDVQALDWHIELSNPQYGHLLIGQALRVLDRIRANWVEATTVSIIVLLVVRLLSSTADAKTQSEAYRFLREARAVTFGWLGKLSTKLRDAELEHQVLDYQCRMCEVAAICRSTYDVDDSHLVNLLSGPEDYLTLISCSAALYDNQPLKLEKAPRHLQVLLCRDRRLAHKVLPIILKKLQDTPHLLDGPVSYCWSDYTPGSGWVALPSPNSRWVSTTTGGRVPQQAQLNLLEGSLLVDGQPLGRLPRDYFTHPTYTRLFGRKVLYVVPANSAGMDFATRTHVEGNQVSFHMQEDSKELIIQASRNDATFELVPQSKLAGDFPGFFSSDYHHWINLITGVVEFRPIIAPWSSNEKNWHLRFSGSSTYIMERVDENGSTLLLDVHSLSFKQIARQIEPLESSQYLRITRASTGPKVSVELPRMRLVFFVNRDGQLESSNFRDQVIDERQSTGTMFGLYNQLVLRAKGPMAKSLHQSRAVLIPHGEVCFELQNSHAQVTINRGLERQVAFHRYKVDTDLGYLASSSTSLTSRLFKIYLHAVTSHCLADPLTGRTGTEEALSELSESATSSFDQIDQEQARLLRLIGALTPQRVYFSSYRRSMETTKWSDLPPLAQHYAFVTATNSIIKRARSIQLFSPLSFDLESYITEFDVNLLERAAYRTCVYYPADATARLPTTMEEPGDWNRWYEGHDHQSSGWTEQGQLASWASGLVHDRWGNPTYTACDLVSQMESWGNVDGPSPDLNLTYSSGWLSLTLSSSWITLYNLSRQLTTMGNRYRLSICLATATYSGRLPQNLVPVLVIFAVNPAFQHLTPPTHTSYQLSDGYGPTKGRIQALISSACRKIEESPANKIPKNTDEAPDDWRRRQQHNYDVNLSELKSQLTQTWLECWPHPPSVPLESYSPWFKITSCLEEVRSYFDSCSRNLDLRNHLRDAEKTLSSGPTTAGLGFAPIPSTLPVPGKRPISSTRPLGSLYLNQLMKRPVHLDLRDVLLEPTLCISAAQRPPPNTTPLQQLLVGFHTISTRPLHRRYGTDLETSRNDLANANVPALPNRLLSLQFLEENRRRYQGYLQENMEIIECLLGPVSSIEVIASNAGIWPRLTPRTILGRLALWARSSTPPEWKERLIIYARAYIEYQRSQRLINLALEQRHEEFYKELNPTNASDSEAPTWTSDPDWLLAQIDGNFGVRAIQTQVAREMISPSSAANTVLQLNMGEGKSSVIVPIVAATLADSSRLVRVVVLKPLWRQMFHLLVSRLAGLVNRRVYYLPFGRQIRANKTQANQIQQIYTECMREGGILLVQPGHILSFKLMGIDRLISSSTPEEVATAHELRGMQEWLSENARDILDESDEILHVRYQLVYSVGEQQPPDGYTDRWTTTQQILSLVAGHLNRLKQNHPDKLKHEFRPDGQFPFIRLMPESDEVVTELVDSVAKDSISGLLPNLNFSYLPPTIRETALRFLADKSFPTIDATLLNALDSSKRNGLLLLRGLLAHGILVLALKDKHYRVDYGLDLNRSLLAVPYHAKDVPSPRAEFGHPDLAIVLTCLSYYNQGLTHGQLSTCFELLYKLDNPALEYELWVRHNTTTPQNLHQLSGVNLKDQEQFVEELVPAFARNSAVVNFFLSSAVFPKELKQFPHKLPTSAWDLAEVKTHVTTGFSGTSDNRYLLPTSIAYSDPVKQSPTNTLVLTYLLQPENNYYLCTRGVNGDTCSTKEFLNLLVKQDPEIRVLLDVGAQMLELKNDELVKYWLELRPDVAAAVYFNEDDERVILPQNGSPVPFLSSPFAQQMEKCVVYLDDGHTRGTDLELPQGSRAAVTLGPKVTKDRLLQGCMRMRKLGRGQSVMFCAPTEIDIQIRKAAGITSDDRVNTLDILRWAMFETCKDLEHHLSHWAQQGVEYNRRAGARQDFARSGHIEALKKGWKTLESRSLGEMYGVSSSSAISPELFSRTVLGIDCLRQRLESLGVLSLQDPSMDGELEREVSHEDERERPVERPPKSQPATHMVHEDVQRFVQSGLVPANPVGIISLFRPLHSSGLLQPDTWSPKLLASVDFSRTLESTIFGRMSEYMRPVNWILSGPGGNLVVLSPYEANQLLPDIRNSSSVQLHVFAPRVIQSRISFSDLRFYSTPSSIPSGSPPPELLLQLQLGLFAGQLYFGNYRQYRALCAFIGIFLVTGANRKADDIRVQTDGFVATSYRKRLAIHLPEYLNCEFSRSPISALKALMEHRRKGMGFSRTHMGQLLLARQLTSNDF
ncbi:hypothetical protein FRC06_000826 [Ceratobasidium sp. 370]|nr:hypothetical protein FRC06_000826 [Ceratobasidium sp. 370]